MGKSRGQKSDDRGQMAVNRKVAASTQNQALSAIVFLYAFTGSGFTVQGYVVLTWNIGQSRLAGMKSRPAVRPTGLYAYLICFFKPKLGAN